MKHGKKKCTSWSKTPSMMVNLESKEQDELNEIVNNTVDFIKNEAALRYVIIQHFIKH